MKWSIWMLVLASLVACQDSKEEELEAVRAAGNLVAELGAAADEVGQQAAAEAEAEAEAAEAPPEAPGEATASAMQGMEQLGQALGAALEARARAEGSTPCEQSWNGVMATLEALHKQLGRNEANMPSRESFMEACNRLPEEVQQCMVPSYAMQHMDECQRVQNNPQVQILRGMMRVGAAN